MFNHFKFILYAILFFSPGYAKPGPFNNSQKEVIRVLSIDSGGIRGLIALSALVKIEEELGQPIAEIFDLIAGSSTGSIIALALSVPNEYNEPKYSARQISEVYERQGKSIFARRLRQKIKSVWGLLRPRYKNEQLTVFLNNFLGNTKISESIVPVLLTGYHLEAEKGLEFFSLNALESPEELDCLMRDVAMASSAAPTYFSPAKINFHWGVMDNVVDGAIFAYNPALLAYGQALKTFGPDKIIEVYSIGTGSKHVEAKHQLFKKRGKIRWAAPITGHLLNANAEATNTVLDRLLNDQSHKRYFRLNLSNFSMLGDLDDIGPENMKTLSEASRQITQSEDLSRIISNLKK